VAAGFKYEPAAGRPDIIANKLPVIAWSNVGTDIERIKAFVAAGAVPVAWSVCVDEGGRYRALPRQSPSVVEGWTTGYATQVTLTRWPAQNSDVGQRPWLDPSSSRPSAASRHV
jgi:hypothetical protein